MKTFLTRVALFAGLALAAPAAAAPGECSMTDYGDFPCDVAVDGGGIVFDLPDGQTFAFVHAGEGEGPGFLTPEDAGPGDRPRELGDFAPLEDRPGCWFGPKHDITFCAALAE